METPTTKRKRVQYSKNFVSKLILDEMFTFSNGLEEVQRGQLRMIIEKLGNHLNV